MELLWEMKMSKNKGVDSIFHFQILNQHWDALFFQRFHSVRVGCNEQIVSHSSVLNLGRVSSVQVLQQLLEHLRFGIFNLDDSGAIFNQIIFKHGRKNRTAGSDDDGVGFEGFVLHFKGDVSQRLFFQ